MTDFVKIVVGCLILMIVMMIFRGWISSPDVVHICLGDKCIYCRKSVDLNHVCYITSLDKSLTQSKEWRYIFYDFESTQDEIDPETGLNIHKVNFAVAMVAVFTHPLKMTIITIIRIKHPTTIFTKSVTLHPNC